MIGDITRRVKLRGAARQLMACRADRVVTCGPAGTGKSYGALFKIHFMALKNGRCPRWCDLVHDRLPSGEHYSEGMKGLVVRKTHRSLAATGLVTFREKVAAEAIERGEVKWYGGSGEKPAQYIYANGSTIVVGGLDNPDKIMSADYDVIFAQELTDCTLDDAEKLTTRLRNGRVSFQQLLADCNPVHPSHWVKQQTDKGAMTMLYSRHEDNPTLYDDRGAVLPAGRAYLDKLDALTGVRKERLRWGRWAAAEGMIYDAWRPDVHVIDTPDLGTVDTEGRWALPREWRRIWAVDFGFTNPFVWQQWAIDGDGRMWLEKEIYRSRRLVEDHARDILRAVTYLESGGKNWRYPKPSAIICDHDAEDRATLERHLGMGTQAAWKGVSDGIQAMQARVRLAGDGKPRIIVIRDSLVERDESLRDAGKPTCFAEEIEGYVWKLKPHVSSVGRNEPDEPLKENDHSMDAARYVVANLDLAPRPRMHGWI